MIFIHFRKLAKSALVLIPLFGVPYIVFLGWQENITKQVEVVKLYFEMTFNAFNVRFKFKIIFFFLDLVL